jgi:hypothetical protein
LPDLTWAFNYLLAEDLLGQIQSIVVLNGDLGLKKLGEQMRFNVIPHRL